MSVERRTVSSPRPPPSRSASSRTQRKLEIPKWCSRNCPIRRVYSFRHVGTSDASPASSACTLPCCCKVRQPLVSNPYAITGLLQGRELLRTSGPAAALPVCRDAFRLMQRSGHIGKIVVTPRTGPLADLISRSAPAVTPSPESSSTARKSPPTAWANETPTVSPIRATHHRTYAHTGE
jgi:hypothetical protein